MAEKDLKKGKISKSNLDCNRRDFLRGSAAVAAGLSLGGMFKSCATAPQLPAAQPDPLRLELEEAALRFFNSPANDMGRPPSERIYVDPIFGVASGADPLWMVFKETAIGSHHWTPREAFLIAYPQETEVMPEELSVLVWVMPHTRATRDENRQKPVLPGERWMRTRDSGERELHIPLVNLLIKECTDRGIQAMSPRFTPGFQSFGHGNFGIASTFSERHAGYAAGMGTFGLSGGLITRAGKANRMGSIVVRARLTPDPRPYTSIHEYCPYFKDGSCGVCMMRCPAGAIRKWRGEEDKDRCHNQLQGHFSYIHETLGVTDDYLICGKCSVGVPCESRIPIF